MVFLEKQVEFCSANEDGVRGRGEESASQTGSVRHVRIMRKIQRVKDTFLPPSLIFIQRVCCENAKFNRDKDHQSGSL